MTNDLFGDTRLPSRFWAKVHVLDDGCWQWCGCLTQKGYGLFGWDGRTQQAHRVAFQALTGDIPPGLETDHLCRNRGCVNPTHCEAVPHQVNLRRGNSNKPRNKTHCPQGHPYDEQNTYFNPRGTRVCRACRRRWR